MKTHNGEKSKIKSGKDDDENGQDPETGEVWVPAETCGHGSLFLRQEMEMTKEKQLEILWK